MGATGLACAPRLSASSCRTTWGDVSPCGTHHRLLIAAPRVQTAYVQQEHTQICGCLILLQGQVTRVNDFSLLTCFDSDYLVLLWICSVLDLCCRSTHPGLAGIFENGLHLARCIRFTRTASIWLLAVHSSCMHPTECSSLEWHALGCMQLS